MDLYFEWCACFRSDIGFQYSILLPAESVLLYTFIHIYVYVKVLSIYKLFYSIPSSVRTENTSERIGRLYITIPTLCIRRSWFVGNPVYVLHLNNKSGWTGGVYFKTMKLLNCYNEECTQLYWKIEISTWKHYFFTLFWCP